MFGGVSRSTTTILAGSEVARAARRAEGPRVEGPLPPSPTRLHGESVSAQRRGPRPMPYRVALSTDCGHELSTRAARRGALRENLATGGSQPLAARFVFGAHG